MGGRWKQKMERGVEVAMVTMQSAEDATSRNTSGKAALTVLTVFEVIVQAVIVIMVAV
jgi:hypothetical protein